MTSRLIFYILL